MKIAWKVKWNIKWYEALILVLTGLCALFFCLTYFSVRTNSGGTVFAQKGSPLDLREVEGHKGVEYAETGESTIGKLNLNQATAEELAKLPQMGEKRAAAIVDWRLRHGPFGSVEDLLQVDGFDRERVKYMEQFVMVWKDGRKR